MNMVTVYRSAWIDISWLRLFPVAALLHAARYPNQNRVSIFGHPYEMVSTIPYRTTAHFAVSIIGRCY